MDDPLDLPEDIDPELWFECPHHAPSRDYLVREPWHTFPGRMQAWCETRRLTFRVSKKELPETLPDATRYWVDGFLVGNVPHQPDEEEFGEAAVIAWRAKAERFLVEGGWPPMSEQRWKWFEDAQVLAAIGRALEGQAMPKITVRIPAELAEHARAAWARDDQSDEVDVDATERAYRQRAGALALIGHALEQNGVAAVDGVDVELSADLVVSAVESGSAP